MITLFGPILSLLFTLRWQTARLSTSLIVTVVTLLPLRAIKSRTPEVCGILLTSLQIHDVPHCLSVVALHLPRNQHEQLYLRSFTLLGHRRPLTPTRRVAVFYGSIFSQIDPFGRFSIRSVFPR